MRQAGCWLVLGAAVALAWPGRTESWTSVILPALSPFIALASVVSVRAVSVLVFLALPVGLMAMLSRRWFCRYGCPVGLLQETLERFPRPPSLLRGRDRHAGSNPNGKPALGPDSADEAALHAGAPGTDLLTEESPGCTPSPASPVPHRGTPAPTCLPPGFGRQVGWERDGVRSLCSVANRPGSQGAPSTLPRSGFRWPALGPWLVLLTYGGAVVGYPIFSWLDPLAIFHGFLNSWREPITLATLLSGLGLPVLLLLDLVAPRLWCQRICPLGATQEFLGWPRRRLQRSQRCADIDSMNSAVQVNPGRRWFFAACAGVAGGMVLRAVRAESAPVLRPPGSLDDWRFTGVCVRCGNCAQVCPSKIIRPDFGEGGLPGLLAPRLRFDCDYCREDCSRCNEVCPSGAIARLSLIEKRRRVIGRARVDSTLCLLAQGRECTACIQKCPCRAIAMKSADGGFSNEPQVILDLCNGCGACEAVCPTRPVRAIHVHARV